MKYIIMNGRTAKRRVKVDDTDYEQVNQYKWHYNNGYAMANINGKSIFMHRFIMQPKDRHEFVDHLNHDTLDNRRKNLRLCDSFVNMQNRKKGRGVIKKSFINKRYYYYGEVRQDLKRYTTTTCENEEQAKGALKQLLKELKKSFIIS